jgi:ABC-type glycerol-3-phosphate transport system substrate-binding protein
MAALMKPRIVAVAVLLFAAACGRQSSPADAKPEVFWRPLGSWSGHGNTQTPSFTSDSGSLRVRWQTRDVPPGAPDGAGTFRLTAQSAISGRPIAVAVDARGAGQGMAYVNDDPHVFYMLVESANLDWSFSVDEAFTGTPSDSSPAGKH